MKITWLHLSDLHYKSGKAAENFNQKIVFTKLWDDINAQMKKGLKPDFIVFTGDVAYHGRKEEYDLAKVNFFDKLLEITGISKENFFIVPGNHDVDRAEIDQISTGGMLSLLRNRDEINQFLSKGQDRSHFFKKFQNYSNFVKEYFENNRAFNENEYFYTHIMPTQQNYELALLGINSTWMCGCHKEINDEVNDQGYLFIGEMQILEALERVKKADSIMAIFHHPIDWLHVIDRFDIEKLLEVNCDFILHGHCHTPNIYIKQSSASGTIYIPCGAAYTGRNNLNCYNFVEFDLNSKHGKIHLRRYYDRGPKGPEWGADYQSFPNGIWEFDLINPPPSSFLKRILLIEDEPEWQEAVQSMLIPDRFELQIASSYAEAMPLLQRSSFNLIIVNLCLHSDNDFEGEAILEELSRKSNNVIPCIILTGKATKMKGLFSRYKFCEEIFYKNSAFNRADFLRAVNSYIK